MSPLTMAFAPARCACGRKVRDLILPDGRQCCALCTTEADDELLADIARRARSVGVRSESGWPYGPNVHVGMRLALLDWAEEHRLTLVPHPHRRCPSWLRTGGCRARRACGHHETRIDPGWTDHPSAWLRNGRPAVLVAQPYPYGIQGPDVDELAALDADPALRVEVSPPGASWYGFDTWFVRVWRVGA